MAQPTALDEDNLRRLVARQPEWQVVPHIPPSRPEVEGIALKRTYTFLSFFDAIHFMNTASRFIDLKDHHPEWNNIWRTLVVYLTTWDIGLKPTMKDVDVATYLDELYEQHYLRQISQQDMKEPPPNVDDEGHRAK